MKFSVFLSLSVTCAVAWKQRGGDIDGEAAGDRSGWSVSLSADGTMLAVGAPWDDGAGYIAGHARVFAWDSDKNEWKQRGDDIDGEAAGDQSGISVSLSADGTALAVGAWKHDNAGSDAGHARVFAWDSDKNEWKQRGGDIDGEAAYDRSGYSVSLSADGTALAVGAPWNDGGGTDAGHARVYLESTTKPDAGGDAGEFGQGDGDLVASGDEDGPACDSEEGRDSRSWHRKDAPTKTCAWVERKPSRRCRKKDATGARAETECARACASCPKLGACVDDPTWSYTNKKNKKLTCFKVRRNAPRRCSLDGAADACRATCGTCV